MRYAPVLALVALAACTEPVPPGPLPMDGEWRQSGDLRDAATGDGHIHLGTFQLSEGANGTFSGTGEQEGICSRPDGDAYTGPLADAEPFAVTNGVVNGLSVSFDTDDCHFTGTFTDATRTRMTGTASCQVEYQGRTYSFEGQWQADR